MFIFDVNPSRDQVHRWKKWETQAHQEGSLAADEGNYITHSSTLLQAVRIHNWNGEVLPFIYWRVFGCVQPLGRSTTRPSTTKRVPTSRKADSNTDSCTSQELV